MKVCLLLLVGTLVLVNAHYDPCDSLAADNELKKNREEDSDQQLIEQSKFYNVPKGMYFALNAAKYQGVDHEKNKFCTVVSHEKNTCGAVKYERWFTETYKPRPDPEGFNGVKMESVTYTVNTSTNSLIKFSMRFVGANMDDYIIEQDKSKSIVAVEYYMDKDGNVKQRNFDTIDTEIKGILGSKFAVNFVDFELGWNLKATCDGKRIWSSITEEALKKAAGNEGHMKTIKDKIEERIKVLKGIIKDELGVDAEVVHDVPTEITEPFVQLLEVAKAA